MGGTFIRVMSVPRCISFKPRANPFNCKMWAYFPSSVAVVAKVRGDRRTVDQMARQKKFRACLP